MKTILYQPLFINPQAYFVFPQLYHIEKGDSYIEPANITGQLIINDLTKSLTLTPILNVVQDTNQVDFGLFKGKHIRISQYTNIGSVVLGEWYVPGTPTPPEPEQPDWFKESIVAWYSPYCKQGMTNFDVIESYAEDFNSNNWKHTNNVTVTNNSFHLTYGNLTYELYPITTYNTKSMTVIVKGLNGIKGFIKYRYGQKGYVDINKDGIYYLPAKIDDANVLGFQTHFKSECDITITQLPTSILKDFSGNGNHAYLYGGKGKLNSGMGVYQQDFSKLIISRVDKKQDSFSFTVSGSGGSYLAYMQLGNWNNKAFKILANINAKSDYLYLRFRNSTDAVITSVMLKNGENIIPAQNIEGATKAVFEYSLKEGESITITQIPDYPDQLCYDGKMYAVAHDMPILTDYTVMAERTWFEKKEYSAFISNSLGDMEYPSNGAFSVEVKSLDSFTVMSFGSLTSISTPEKGITYQTKQSYNGNSIKVGTKESNDILTLGGRYFYKNVNVAGNTWNGCHGDILLFNRSLTEYEISWVKNNLMCSKPQEPDKDDILKSLVVHYNVSKQGSNSIKSTNTLTDYSGNNRHATCKNFNWVNTQFVDDGKAMRFDSNGSCIVGINMPQLDKYTIIAKRRWIDKKSENKWFCSLGNGDYTSASQSLFWFEGGLLNNVFYTYNKGYKNPIVLPELISIQSSDDYNGVRINSSNGVQAGNKLFIGSVGENDNAHVVADFYQLLLFDRVLTDEEREWVKENLIEPDTVSAAKACTALFEPENLEITDEYPTGIIRDSLGGGYYMVAHSDDYTIENGLMKSTDNTFLVSIENANENDVKAMIIDMYYDSTVPGSYLNGEYTEGSVKLTNRRIMGINNPTTTSIFQDLMQVLETGFTIGKIALYNKELTKDEFDSEAFHKGFAVRHSTFEKNASTHLFRDGHKELTPGEYLLPFETLYLRVDVPEGYTMQDYVFDEVEQSWKPNTPKSYICPEHDFHIIAMGEQMKVIKNWSPLASISTFGFRATDNQVEFAGSTDSGTMSYILDDTDVTKFTIEYTNTAGEGNVYLIIGDRQYDVISGQPQTYSVSGAVKLDFLNMEEVANFAGTIKFTNVV